MQRGVERSLTQPKGLSVSTYAYWIGFVLLRGRSRRRAYNPVADPPPKAEQIKKNNCLNNWDALPKCWWIGGEQVTPNRVRRPGRARLPVVELTCGEIIRIRNLETLEDWRFPKEFVMQSCMSTDLERLMADLTPQQRGIGSAFWFGWWTSLNTVVAIITSVVNRVRQIRREALTKLRK